MTSEECDQFSKEIEATYEKFGVIDFFYGVVDVSGEILMQSHVDANQFGSEATRRFVLIGAMEEIKAKIFANLPLKNET